MADKPSSASGPRAFNIMGLLRGNFDFSTAPPESKTVAYGSRELISKEARSKILSGAFRAVKSTTQEKPSTASILGIVQTSLSKMGNERLENRKILQLMPTVDKAARLMVASTLSPNDLTRQEINVTYDTDDIVTETLDRLSEHATTFFQKKLNLKTSAASWIYQWGYEAGSCIFAIIPLRSFDLIQQNSYVGVEKFVEEIVDPIAQESFFGFGDVSPLKEKKAEAAALESFSHKILVSLAAEDKDNQKIPTGIPKELNTLVEKFLAQESLSLTDNPSILQLNEITREKADKRTKDILNKKYRNPKVESIVSVSPKRSSEDGEKGVVGNPILLRLPPEAVTVIHTPGDPNDHQGYLVLLDRQGNPIDAVIHEENANSLPTDYGKNQGNIFNQVYNAYGLTTGFRGLSDEETMSRIYTQIVSEHIRNRISKAGYSNISIGNVDSVFRCMFARFLQQKQTRVLFLPKDLVSYMTFEMDQNGYGVSRLDRIKFNLGMKMAVQVSRVLAAIKAAMDRRKIELKFTDNLIEQPEAIFQNVIREYINKSTMSFSIDPNVIQNQIADKSVSIQGIDIPGMEQFSLTNEPDQRTASVDFDPSILEYIDKEILNGLHVPASTMNSLNEDEYARSVTTTNLFFSMDVSIDQDMVIKNISDLLKKYARYSEEFQKGVYDICPSLDSSKKEKRNESSSIDSNVDSEENCDSKKTKTLLPDYYTIDKLIDSLSITLPHPNVAPSKAQFESLDAMIQSITNTMNAIFPDDLMGSDDTLAPVVRLLRSKFTSVNIKSYLDGSGLNGIEVPDSNFTDVIGGISKLMEGLQNIEQLLKDKAKLVAPKEEATPIEGY